MNTIKPIAATTDTAEGLKVAVSAVMRTTERAVEALGGDSGLIRNTDGEIPHHPLGESFFTQVPHLHGDYFGKFSLAPVSPELTALAGQELDVRSPDALRDAMLQHFAVQGGTWELRVQLCTDHDAMPVEIADQDWLRSGCQIGVGRSTRSCRKFRH